MHSMSAMEKTVAGILVIMGLLFSLPLVSASATGTSSISLSQRNVSIYQGWSGSVNYTVTLASGQGWTTNLTVNNENQLLGKGINVSMSNSHNYVPFSGTLNINVASSTPGGTYYVILSATGSNPSISNATLALTVLPTPPPVTSIGPITSNTTASNFLTTSTPSSNPQYVYYLYLILALVVIAIIVGFILLRGRTAKS